MRGRQGRISGGLCLLFLAASAMLANATPNASGLSVQLPGGNDISGGQTIPVLVCEMFCVTLQDIKDARTHHGQDSGDSSGDAGITAVSGSTSLMEKDTQNADDRYGSSGFSIPLSDFSSQEPNQFGLYCINWCDQYEVNNNTTDQEGGTPDQDHDDGGPTEEGEFYATKVWQWDPVENPTTGWEPDDPEEEPASGITLIIVKQTPGE